MEIMLRAHTKRVKRKIERDFQWYDTVSKKMLLGRGGAMRFRYVTDQKRVLPYLVDQEQYVFENDFGQIEDWIHKHARQYDIHVVSSARQHFALVSVPVQQFDEVIESLYREHITFDYDENELKRERAEATRETQQQESKPWPSSRSRSRILLP